MLSLKQRMVLSSLVISSALLCLLAAALQAGYEHPIQMSDSHGNKLGFNDSLTWELYGILLRSASLKAVLGMLGWYGVSYLSFHLAALVVFARRTIPKARRITASCFIFQVAIFPLGLLGIMVLPVLVCDFFGDKIDGETMTDFPFPFWCLFQGPWLVASALAGFWILRNTKKNLRTDAASSVSPRLCGS
ncbi:MAG: hypothetical protein RLY20_1477 [Verrucomicrobiota bacterium]|jgi:hypothetical protein